MAVNAVTSAFANYAQAVTGRSASSGGSSTSAALQEANETPAQTTKEAHAGDPVAKAKLLRAQLKQQQQQAEPPASEPGKGAEVDHKG